MRRMVLAAFVLAALGCDGGKPPAGAPGAKKTYRFALVPKMLNNPVFNCGHEAAKAAKEEIEKKEGVAIEILWSAPSKSNPAEQAQIVRSYGRQKVDGVSVSVDEPNALKKAIDEVAADGVPVMTFDSDSPDSKRRVFFGTNDTECGERLAKYLGAAVKKGKVAIQSGTAAPNLVKRVEGAKAYLAKHHPEIQVVNTLFCNDDTKKAIDDITSFTSANPDLAGWILVGGWALFGNDALKAVDPAKTKVVSCDALPEMWKYLESGKCQMLLAQDLWGWGEQSVRILKDLADGREVKTGPGGAINGALEEVTAETLEAFKKKFHGQFKNYGK